MVVTCLFFLTITAFVKTHNQWLEESANAILLINERARVSVSVTGKSGAGEVGRASLLLVFELICMVHARSLAGAAAAISLNKSISQTELPRGEDGERSALAGCTGLG